MLLIGVLFYLVPVWTGKPSVLPTDGEKVSWKEHAIIGCGIFCFAPLIILLHECAHWIGGSAVGFKLILQHDQILMPPQGPLKNFPTKMLILTVCGPLVEFTFSTIGCIALWRFRTQAPATSRIPVYWLWTLLAICGLRWLRCDWQSQSDERDLSRLLGLSDWTLSGVMLFPALFVLWLIIDVHRRNRTEGALLCAFVTGVISALLYLNVLGPLLFAAGPKVES